MKTVYAATWVEKLASDWSPRDGASPEPRCIMNKGLDITASSVQGLIDAISSEFFVEIDVIHLGEEHDGVRYIEFNRVETGDSEEPTDVETKAWEEGKLKLYLCDYSFTVEKRIVRPLERGDFEGVDVTID